MRKFVFYLLFIFSVTSFAQPYGHRYVTEQATQNITIDINTNIRVSIEWGEGDWDGAMGSAFGYGLSTDGTNWTWVQLPWFEDGSGSNKRCRTDVIIAIPGKYYYAYRMIKAANGGTTYSFGSDTWLQNSSTLSAVSTIIVGEVSKAIGFWNSTGTWEDGTVPSSSDNVAIMHDVNVSSSSQAASSVYVYDDKTLTIQNTGDLTISNGLTISSGAKGAGTLIVNSGASNTGSLITNGSIDGNVSVERYLSQGKYHYVSSPISNGTYSTLQQTPNSENDFFQYITTTNTWEDLNDGDAGSTALVIGRGYAVQYAGAGSVTKIFTGTLNNGDVTYSVTAAGIGNNAGTNLLGNPYPSAIDAKLFLSDGENTELRAHSNINSE